MPRVRTFGILVFAGLAGLGPVGADYAVQWSRAGSDFGRAQYMTTLIERFGDRGGIMGQVLRRSSLVDAALPPAPPGWTVAPRATGQDAHLFSPAQATARNRELGRATFGLPSVNEMTRREVSAFDRYREDTTRAYRTDNGLILLSVEDPDHSIPYPVWQAHIRAIDSHFARIDTLIEHSSAQDLTWFEVLGPVQIADDGRRPHRLRGFAARIGAIELRLTTRAPDAMISRFLDTVDLGDLRALAARAGRPVGPDSEKIRDSPPVPPATEAAQVRLNRPLD
ncbi:hypothetical protein KZZ07_04825 [Mameliella sp. CS4]|uniref:hypothetical protein n=1 Tax=Mameliella sp. CS4 TaxID=2862329 RepID=UPI001C5D94F9|nr:hypothetical protein [Mameliella sp. CS4]MBW4981862.1 hypothetical protein [Mameliella sp. CS4]